eukprot:TRINITY_DN3794_c1_g1_i1.p4 TRINITY_DN3794_c1_g1~~TRINITY_DN3794_c1_g1_i1.p4  ORF type:complete len:143 (-),score=9.65 TRINITY_DN3794_c1_g1_i1:200-628(-)
MRNFSGFGHGTGGNNYVRVASQGTGASTSVSSSSVSASGSNFASSQTTQSGGGVASTRNVIGSDNIVTTREDNESLSITLERAQTTSENTVVDVIDRKIKIQGLDISPFVYEFALPPNALTDSMSITRDTGVVNIYMQKASN